MISIKDFGKVSSQTKANEDLNERVLGNAGDLFNEFCYVYKERYEKMV